MENLVIVRFWECMAPEHLDRCTDEDPYHATVGKRVRKVNSFFCGWRTEAFRCDHPGCPETVDLRRWSLIRAASYYGWMLKQDDSEAWCFKHLPEWVIPWRDKHRPGWRNKLSKRLFRELEAAEAGRGDQALTIDQRIEARHLLQSAMETCRSVRNAMEPQTGVMRITVESLERQINQVIAPLEQFAERVREGKPANPYNIGDRSA